MVAATTSFDMTPSATGVTAAAIAVAFFYYNRSKTTNPLPPGPKGIPLLGNYLAVPGPQDEPWVVFDQWSRQYGRQQHLLTLHVIVIALYS
jgi:hypothetical protein